MKKRTIAREEEETIRTSKGHPSTVEKKLDKDIEFEQQQKHFSNAVTAAVAANPASMCRGSIHSPFIPHTISEMK